MSSVADNAIAAVRAGKLVVIPTDTQYAVIADAFNASALSALRAAKGIGDDVPLPVGVGSLETALGVALLDGLALDLAAGLWPGALTMLVAPQGSLSWHLGGHDAALAIRVPAHDVALEILNGIGPCVMTGVGGSKTVAAAKKVLGDSVELYVPGGTLVGGQSTVVDATGEHLRVVREGSLALSALREVVPMVVKGSA